MNVMKCTMEIVKLKGLTHIIFQRDVENCCSIKYLFFDVR